MLFFLLFSANPQHCTTLLKTLPSSIKETSGRRSKRQTEVVPVSAFGLWYSFRQMILRKKK